MRACTFLCITLLLLCHPQLWSQTVTKQFPPAAPATIHGAAAASIPVARVVPAPPTGVPVEIQAHTQSFAKTKAGNIYTLTGQAIIHYRDYVVHADRATYNQTTGDVTATGHLALDGGPDNAHLLATRGVMNLKKHTARLYNVSGTIGGGRLTRNSRKVLTSSNPFAISARELVETAPRQYQVIDGAVTSCALPHPDWQLVAHRFLLDNGQATAKNSLFELRGLPILHRVPIFYLPYVTHPVNNLSRQSGFLIPIFGDDSIKGAIVGEDVYFTLGPSADIMLGAEYFSKRGFAPLGLFRYRGRGLDFVTVGFHSLLDKRPGAQNQGGVDLVADGRHDFSPQTRIAGDIEYLSSYAYRQVFEENYSSAINSEVKSQLYYTHADGAQVESVDFNRYQSFESNATSATGEEEIRILHVPTVEWDALDQSLAGTPLVWGATVSGSALSRSEPGYQTSTIVPRLDFHPHLALPMHFDGWTVRPLAAVRDTFYGKSQNPAPIGALPSERDASLNRKDFEAVVDLRPPAIERTFTAPWIERLTGGEARHVLEPMARYRYVTGIDNFKSVLRFDDTDVASNTNEIEYGLTQRLYIRNMKPHPCKGAAALGPRTNCAGATADTLSWQIEQKYFFNPTFGGAVTPHTRNVLDTTLDLTGVAFLKNPRHYSPIISRLHWQNAAGGDLEWDVDYDTKTGRLDASNLFAGYTLGNYSFSMGDAHLHTVSTPAEKLPSAPGVRHTAVSTSQPITDYNQLRFAAIYGSPVKLGLSAGVTSGYDFTLDQWQYYGTQASYNWNCCGFSFELRHYSLGSVRNDTEELYSFTLAGVGTAGSLKRAERVITGLSPF